MAPASWTGGNSGMAMPNADARDVLQTTTWQVDLLAAAAENDAAAAELVRATRSFADAYRARGANEDGYLALLRRSVANFQRLRDVGDRAAFDQLVIALRDAIARRTIAPIQGGHLRLPVHLDAAGRQN